jgi:hypothetical protein
MANNSADVTKWEKMNNWQKNPIELTAQKIREFFPLP